MNASFSHYTRRDVLIALLLAVLVFLCGLGGLTNGVSYWGDDFAAYMNQAIAIADGDMEAQTQRNFFMHMARAPEEGESLVYVWGYPLLLSLVYRAVGFDIENYSTVIYYKLPGMICFALCAAVFYLFVRRRFEWKPALFMALIFPVSGTFLYDVNILYSDLVFIFFSMLLLLMGEIFVSVLSGERLRPGAWILAVLLGMVMWYTYETRLNGVTVCIMVLIAQLLSLIRRGASRNLRHILCHILPYVVFASLVFVSERFFLPSATSNMDDVGATTLKKIFLNFAAYGYFSLDFLDSLPGFNTLLFLPIAAVCVLGYAKDGFRRENLHLSLLILGTYVVNILLPYRQGPRYLYNIFPLLILFLGYGARHTYAWLLPRLKESRRKVMPKAVRIAAVAIILAAYLNVGVSSAINRMGGAGLPHTDVYSPQAIETYRYIRENTEEDDLICFFKPRALYLNTNRLAYCTKPDGKPATDADYYLWYEGEDNREKFQITPENEHRFELEFSTDNFALYKVLPEAA